MSIAMFGAAGDGGRNPVLFRNQSATSSSTSGSEVQAVRLMSNVDEMCDKVRAEIDEYLDWKPRMSNFSATAPFLDRPAHFKPDLELVRARALDSLQTEIDLVTTMSREQREVELQRATQLRSLERKFTKEVERARRAQIATDRFRAILSEVDADINQRLELMNSEVPNSNCQLNELPHCKS